MKDYSEMSDFKINQKVAMAVFGKYETYKDSVYADSMGDGENVVPVNGIYDPCNNPADAWSIIQSNRIPINPVASYWQAGAGGDKALASDKNPLRAAMIVFLMIKEEGNESN